MFGRYFSSIGIRKMIEESFIENRSVLTIPSRRSVKMPSAGTNGAEHQNFRDIARFEFFLARNQLRFFHSTLRFGTVFPPATQTVIWLSIKPFAVIHDGCRDRISTAGFGDKFTCLCFSSRNNVQFCSSIVFSDHEPFSNVHDLSTAFISTSFP